MGDRKAKAFPKLRRSRRLAGLSPPNMRTATRLAVRKRNARCSQCNRTNQLNDRVTESERTESLNRSNDEIQTDRIGDETREEFGASVLAQPVGTDDCLPSTSVGHGDPEALRVSRRLDPTEPEYQLSETVRNRITPRRTSSAEDTEDRPSSSSNSVRLMPSGDATTDPVTSGELNGTPTQDIMQTFTDHIGGVPVQGESFCHCPKRVHCKDLKCTCGEEDSTFEWTWDRSCKSSASIVSENGHEARFHVNYSSGTAAVRGSDPMTDGQYFWEIKMITPVYGTDMMVGVGTANVDLDAFQYNFCSLLGRDSESWGLSYYGKAQHKGQFNSIRGARFGQGSILGLHLDMWQGTLSYYKNRQPLGVIFTGLRGKTLYPMISSTAARTGMKLVKACSYATSLEFLCCQVLRKMVPQHLDVTTALSLPPGLHEFFLVNNLFWLLRSNKLSIPNLELVPKRRRLCDQDIKDQDADACETEPTAKRSRKM